MITEADAKTKWCPFVLIRSTTGPAAVNRDPGDPKASLCLGSGCMAWLTSGHCGLVLRQQVSI